MKKNVIGSVLMLPLLLVFSHIAIGQSDDGTVSSIDEAEPPESALSSGSARQLELLNYRTEQLAELREAASQLSQLRENLQKQESDLAVANSEIERLTQQMSTVDAEKLELRALIDAAKDANEALRAQLEMADSEHEKLKAQVAAADTEKEELKSRTASAGSEIEVLRAESVSLKNENEALKTEADSLKNDNEVLSAETESLKKDYETLRAEADALKNDNEALRTNVDTLQSSNEALQPETVALKNDNEALSAESDALKNENEALTLQATTALSENESLKADVAAAKTENEALKTDAEAASQEIESLKQKVITLEEDLSRVAENEGDSNSQISSLNKKIDSLGLVLQEKEKLIETLSLRVKQEEKKSESVSEIRKAYFNLKEANAALVSRLGAQSKSADESDESAGLYEQRIAELEQELSTARESQQNMISSTEFERANQENKSLAKNLSDLEQSLSQLNAENKARAALLDEFGLTEDSLQEYLLASRGQNARIATLEKDVQQATQVQDQLKNSEQKIIVLEAELVNLRGANETLEKELAENKAQTKILAEREVAREADTKQETKSGAISSTPTEPKSDAVSEVEQPVTSSQSNTGTGQSSVLALNGSWSIRIGENGPVDYLDVSAVKQLKVEMPGESDCQEFVQKFNDNPSLPEQLSVNGFPVSVFWIKRRNGAVGICKIGKSAANIFRASISRSAPSRADKAILPGLQ